MKKTVIITGSSGAIGNACVNLFKEDFNVVGVDIKPTEGIFSIEADISKSKDIDMVVNKTIEKFGSVDVLVNSAAFNAWEMNTDDTIEERWDNVFANDLKSIYLLTERVVVEMAKSGGGNIINLGSIAGYVLGSKSLPYAATKSAVVGITKSHARIYGSYNIKVNSIAPGIIDNERSTRAEHEVKLGYNTAIKNQTPLNRWGRPEEIAELVYFLGQDKCSFITGQTIVVDGGATLTCGLRVDEPQPFRWEKFTPKGVE